MWREGEGKSMGVRPDRPFSGRSEADLQHLSSKWAPLMGALGEPRPIRQDCCGTIEAWSNGETTMAGDDERRSLARWNNIRRSNALERRNG